MTKINFEKLWIVIFTILIWYIIFWYFTLPEIPFTYLNEKHDWMFDTSEFPYSSSTTMKELPAIWQQFYIIGFLVFYYLLRLIDWIIDKVLSII